MSCDDTILNTVRLLSVKPLPSMTEALGLKSLQLSNINRITFSYGRPHSTFWEAADSEIIGSLLNYFGSIQAEEYEVGFVGGYLNDTH